jgi:hypothetical protein
VRMPMAPAASVKWYRTSGGRYVSTPNFMAFWPAVSNRAIASSCFRVAKIHQKGTTA